MVFRGRLLWSTLFSLCCLLLMGTETAFGQTDIPIDPTITVMEGENTYLRNKLDAEDLNRITIQQIDEHNRATILQFSTSENPNYVNVYQEGELNRTILIQTGQNNAADIIQEGNGNKYQGIHIGEDIISSVVQEGNENTILQFLHGKDMDFRIEQLGNSNEVTQFGSGIGYKVTQKGDNMNIKIIQDYVLIK